ncbi:hypothetical protein [Bdellovibrio sp. HCB288]|uniref:hypothetical protein n=1 Tax=Bdellovibrio sp. HCB288 TaxID=3394355 RepID=UPI0039B562EE
MKLSKLLATAVLMSLAACAVKDDKASRVALRGGDTTPKGEVSADLTVGGQPGQIMVTGAIVKIDENKTNYDEPSDKMSLNPAIKVTVVGGLSADGKVVELDPDFKPMLNLTKSETILTEVTSDTSYAVLGCSDDQVDASYTNGLTKKQVEATADQLGSVISAKVVFVCGDLKTTAAALVIKADTLVLNSANIISTAQAGMVDIGANKLALNGENSIQTIGQDAVTNVLPAASIEFNVTKEAPGDATGTLVISSKGGDIKAGAAKSTIGTSDQQKAKDQQEEQELSGKMALDTTR